MAVLAIDIGNSRIKWGWHDGSRWVESGAIDHAERPALALRWGPLPPGLRAIGSNVAHPEIAQSIDGMLGVQGIAVRWIESRPDQCGVRNLYADPSQLGTDRWAALIAARAMCPGACVVLAAGTAVTMDALTADGEFLGGLILPGMSLMPRALARDTARLPRDAGAYRDFPRTTADAIASGTIDAIAGAVARLAQRLCARAGGPVALIATGGAVAPLLAHLPPEVRVVENLVLKGLLAIHEAT